MTRVVPTEEDPPGVASDLVTQGGNVNDVASEMRVHQPRRSTAEQDTDDDVPLPAGGQPPVDHPASKVETEEQDQQSPANEEFGNAASDAAKGKDSKPHLPAVNGTGGGDTGSPVNSAGPFAPKESQPQAIPNDSKIEAKIETKSETKNEAGVSAQVVSPPEGLEMHEHSDITTFSVTQPYKDMSSDKSSPRQAANNVGRTEEREHSSGASSLPDTPGGREESENDSKTPVSLVARRGTRRYVPRSLNDAGADSDRLSGSGKRAPFRVPQTMFMGHPVGSMAAEFLERQEHRMKHVKTRRDEVGLLMNLVTNHDPQSGSPLPDIDVVFPVDGSDHAQGDWYL